MPSLRRPAPRGPHARRRGARRLPHTVLRPLVASLVVAVGLVAAAPVAAATPDVPRDFFGVHADGPLLTGAVPLDRELRRIRSTGLRTIRVGVFWNEAQPYRTAAEVPADQQTAFGTQVAGVPTDFSRIDRVMAAAADAGLRVLPVVQGSPRWAADGGSRAPNVPPRDPADYARFMGALVERYGSRGAFWGGSTARRRTVLGWQVWNEPNLTNHWTTQPFESSYVRTLRAAATAIREADSRATVYLAALTSASDLPAWRALDKVYEKGGRRSFDRIAVNAFTAKPSGVVTIVRRTRAVARRAGDARKPIDLTEVSWSSSGGDSKDTYPTWDVSERLQATRASQVMRTIARSRRDLRIGSFTWYTWLSPDVSRETWTKYSGLSRLDGTRVVRKPALTTLRREIARLR